MYKSKRFLAFIVATILFVVMIYTTEFTPMEIAGSITIITGVYIAGNTLRKSDKE